MALLSSNFESNALSGIVRVSGGTANIRLRVSKWAFEGDKNFVVKLRRDSFDGVVISTSNVIALVDRSEVISLTPNVSTVNEGNLVTLTLVTSNVVNGTNVFYSVFPVTANVDVADFFGGNSGIVTIDDNVGYITLSANADYSLIDEAGETFKVQLRTTGTSGNIVYTTSNIAIADFYKTYNIFRFEENASTVAEGSTVTFTVFAHNISPGTLLYYYTSGTAEVNSNVGSIAMNSVSNTITLTTASTVPTGDSRSFSLNLASSNLGNPIATSNSITVVDSSLAYLTASGGNISVAGGYRTHVFNTSGTFSVTNLGLDGSVEMLLIGGGGAGGYTTNPVPVQTGGGGGGAGGFVYIESTPLSTGDYSVIVGGGGSLMTTAPSIPASRGSNTSFSGEAFANILSVGGGSGGSGADFMQATPGGSGGGAGNNNTGGAGWGYPGPAQQGFPGANNPASGGGGAGGAGVDRGSTVPGGNPAGAGGVGLISAITGSNVYYAGGGGGSYTPQLPVGGAGGLGGGGPGRGPTGVGSGNVSTGGGGGGSNFAGPGGTGGSGIVIIRYPYVNPPFFNSVTANSSLVLEGSNAFFVVNTTFANTSTLYYDTIGNVTTSNFVNGNTGSFVVTGNATVLRLETTSTVPAYETRNFALRIREDSATTGNIRLVSSNVAIADATGTVNYISATGGTESLISGYKIHTFTSSGTFTINSGAVSPSGNVIDYLVVAGGGSGGPGVSGQAGGGGGAGGLRTGTYVANLGSFAMVVGAGGSVTAPTNTGNKGSNSSIFSNVIISSGGGGGGASIGLAAADMAGGSGGGHGAGGSTNAGGLSTSGQGFPGGANNNFQTGGGGGAGEAGRNSDNPTSPSKGGNGAPSLITGANVIYAGGGGGGQRNNPPGIGAIGGNGGGGQGGNVPATGMTAGTVNTGGGGGGAGQNAGPTIGGAAGGSGIIIVRYPYI